MLQVTMVGATFRPAEAKDIVREPGIGDRVQLHRRPEQRVRHHSRRRLFR
jgi:hypothetical protein